MSKSTSISSDSMLVEGQKNSKPRSCRPWLNPSTASNSKALFGSPILFTLWLAAVMETVVSLLGQPFSGVAPSLTWQLTARLYEG